MAGHRADPAECSTWAAVGPENGKFVLVGSDYCNDTSAFVRDSDHAHARLGRSESIFGLGMLGMLLVLSVIVPINNKVQTISYTTPIYPAI